MLHRLPETACEVVLRTQRFGRYNCPDKRVPNYNLGTSVAFEYLKFMITRSEALIRTTDPDDAGTLYNLYASRRARFALLDQKREPLLPTKLELREMLASKETDKSMFYSVESPDGILRGFFVLRGLNQEGGYCEVSPMLEDEEDYGGAIGREALDYVVERAFGQLRLRKVVSHLLAREGQAAALLMQRGFTDHGTQRQAVYTGGRWHDIRAFGLYNPAFKNAPAN